MSTADCFPGGKDRDILERRLHTRYSVRAHVHFKWQDGGILKFGSGLTRDISTKGMFIYAYFSPPEKADIALEISFVSAAMSVTKLRMKAAAVVIRVEGAAGPNGHAGFAVLNRTYALHSADEHKA